MTDLFYVFGVALTVMAVVLAVVGMRSESFPSRPAMIGGIALMAFLVVGSAAYAVMLAREEQEHRDEEIAEFREEEEALLEEEGAAAEEDPEVREAGDVEAEDALALTSPEAGDLFFTLVDDEAENPTLEAPAGEVSIDYTNPSPVPHNVAIEDGSETVAQGATVTDGDNGAASATLEAGEYVYYCSIPSHREAGMEGELIVE